MSAAITASGNALHVDVPKLLFRARPVDNFGTWLHGYAVSPDGQRFLINSRLESEVGKSAPLTVVLNWTKALKY